MADEAAHPEEKRAEHREHVQAGQKILVCDKCPHCGRQTAAGGPGLALCHCCRNPVRF